MSTENLAHDLHLHLVSDATGETLTALSNAAMSQFDHIAARRHHWFMVRSVRQLEDVLTAITAKPGLVLHTLVNEVLRDTLEAACRQHGLPHVAVLDPVLAQISRVTGQEITHRPGRQHVMDAEYFERMEALNFTILHDDGQLLEDLRKADIVLTGVSRTSKTPTSIYLANRGFRVANVPLVAGLPVPWELEALDGLTGPMVVGLTNSVSRLVQVRRFRLSLLTGRDDKEDPYADPGHVREEIKMAQALFARHKWPVIDVSRRSVEETAAAVLKLHSQREAAQDRKAGQP